MLHSWILFKNWYENRESREKILIVLLTWAVIYVFFYYGLYNALDAQSSRISADIKQLRAKSATLQKQLDILNAMASSANYKAWVAQRKTMEKVQEQYKILLKSSHARQWQDIFKSVLVSQHGLNLQQIKNLPETIYSPGSSSGLTGQIFQQQLILSFTSSYNATVDYLKKLEESLPNIHWDNLSYEVAKFPEAKVTLEFSILYEKNN